MAKRLGGSSHPSTAPRIPQSSEKFVKWLIKHREPYNSGTGSYSWNVRLPDLSFLNLRWQADGQASIGLIGGQQNNHRVEFHISTLNLEELELEEVVKTLSKILKNQ